MRTLLVAIGFFASLAVAVQDDSRQAEELLDLLLWYPTPGRVEPARFPPDVFKAVEGYLQRLESFHSRLPPPDTSSSEMAMVRAAHAGYERRLAAVSPDPRAPALAAAYVQALKPCYEWEGFHDCPEHEAAFADKYIADHPGGPLNPYLQLLSAHRWLCASEGYEREKRRESAMRARSEYTRRLASAMRSADPMIRTAAEAQARRDRCHSGRE